MNLETKRLLKEAAIAKDKRRLKKFGLKTLVLKNNMMWYVKILRADHFGIENRLAKNIIRLNKTLLKD